MARRAPHHRPGAGGDRYVGSRRPAPVRKKLEMPTATLMLDGKQYEVTGELALRLRETLMPYIAAARPAS